MTRLLLTFEFDARNPWHQDEPTRAAARARKESGSSSIRISKATSAALTDLMSRVRQAIPDAERGYTNRHTPDELLAAIAAGAVVFPAPAAACKPERPRKVHAKSPRGRTHAKKVGRGKVHAKSKRSRKAHAAKSTSATRRRRA